MIILANLIRIAAIKLSLLYQEKLLEKPWMEARGDLRKFALGMQMHLKAFKENRAAYGLDEFEKNLKEVTKGLVALEVKASGDYNLIDTKNKSILVSV